MQKAWLDTHYNIVASDLGSDRLHACERRTNPLGARKPPTRRRRSTAAARSSGGFYRDLVWNLRNGVVAVTGTAGSRS